ncbi:mCG1049180 [Mus musculus]|nr:mCG1049180 [Mus musculus]
MVGEPPCGCWDLNSGPSEEQSVLLTPEPSLWPPWYKFFMLQTFYPSHLVTNTRSLIGTAPSWLAGAVGGRTSMWKVQLLTSERERERKRERERERRL